MGLVAHTNDVGRIKQEKPTNRWTIFLTARAVRKMVTKTLGHKTRDSI